MTDPIQPVPPGCQEIPGYILPVFAGKLWITQDGDLTNIWSRRGIWPTAEDAMQAKDRFTKDLE